LLSFWSDRTNVSQVLAIGFLLVILSSALFHNYLPLLVVATYVIAPLPNWICGRCANPDDFMENAGNAVIDFGRFCTGFLVVMGIGRLDVFLLDLEPKTQALSTRLQNRQLTDFTQLYRHCLHTVNLYRSQQ
jgi:Vacuolar protein sorting 55